jgi:hypothetical protein
VLKVGYKNVVGVAAANFERCGLGEKVIKEVKFITATLT